MATAIALAPAIPSRTSTPPPHLTLNTSSRGTPAAIPNKHIPVCSPGPRPIDAPETPPASPPTVDAAIEITSTTYPPHRFEKICNDPPLYALRVQDLREAMDHMSNQPLPHTRQVFPWLHGLHAENRMQLGFFLARNKSLRKVPRCLRGLTIVKAGGDLSTAKIKGAVAPEEIIELRADDSANFIEIDPKDGFSVRNFQIQTCKMATVSDIIVYQGDRSEPSHATLLLAKRVSRAQRAWERFHGLEVGLFNTFVLTGKDYSVEDAFGEMEASYPDLVAINSYGCLTGQVMDLFYWERLQMAAMSACSEISNNVFLGPSSTLAPEQAAGRPSFDVQIEATDYAQIPTPLALHSLDDILSQPDHPEVHIEFPSSGNIMPPTWSHTEVDCLLETCRWMYEIANHKTVSEEEEDKNNNNTLRLKSPRRKRLLRPQRIIIHCADGYTESSLLALTYFMYAEGLPVHEAWVRLHREKGRNFFAYSSDVALLTSIQPRILQESPVWKGDILQIKEPRWLSQLDGSLPSRILPYMYLGNLNHANNPELLRELGITQVLSVGESVNWYKDRHTMWQGGQIMCVDRVQDNGVDPLTGEFERCLEFIRNGKMRGTATLVHCRVGVSRSATICIAEVMKELGLSFPRAYCFVRARRLNVIIQPHLRFIYELLKWEEALLSKRGQPLRRELEWATIAREIALLNKPYSRQ